MDLDYSDLATDMAADAAGEIGFSDIHLGPYTAQAVRIPGEAASALGKHAGTYYTLTWPGNVEADTGELIAAMHKLACSLVNIYEPGKVMVVGLGNPLLAADSFGDRCASELSACGCGTRLSVLKPGVGGITGIDSTTMVKHMIEALSPSLVVMLDALITRDPAKMLESVQISDAPLPFGSGTSPKRGVLSVVPQGLPVLSIGYATTCRIGCGNGNNIIVTPADVDERVGATASACARLLAGLFC